MIFREFLKWVRLQRMRWVFMKIVLAEKHWVTQPLKSKWHVFEQSKWRLGAHLLSKHFRNFEWQDPRVSNFEQFSVFSMCYFAVIASFWVVIDRTNPFAEAKPVQDRKLVTVQCLVCHCFIILLWFVRKLAGCLQESVPTRTFIQHASILFEY